MSSLSSLSGLTFSGLATGIDTNKIVEGLTTINQRQINNLQTQKNKVIQQQAVFGSLEAKLFDFQGQVSRVARSIAGVFDGKKATSSDDTILTAAASTSAQTGSFSLTVNTLAQSQQLASTGVTDVNTNIKTGTFSIRVGNGSVTNITVDGSNNTLQGLANTINNSGSDVKASIIKDGTATPYRLLLTSNKTGANNTIQITENLTGGSGASITLANQTIQEAKNAEIKIGSGANALTISSESNRVDNVIDGVTVNLVKADPSKTVTLNVNADTENAKKALEDFVASYNGLVDFIDEADNFDSATQSAGVLLGNRDVLELQNDLENALSTAVGGVNGQLNRINAVGISFNDKGRLEIDSGKLNQALNGGVSGVTLEDFRRLFALSGKANNPGVNFILGSDKTKPSGVTPYEVNITRAATRASITGTNTLAGSIVINSSNNAFTIKVNNISSTLITIDQGTYTSTSLASTLQGLIKANTAIAGNQVAVDLDGNRLRLTSQLFGNSSQVSFASGTALADLGFIGTEVGVGQNVAGSFKVNGVTEAASGLGQVLSGNSGNANTDGLQVRVALDSTQVGAGVTSNLTVSEGVGARLSKVLNRYLDPVDGRFKSIEDRFTQNIKDVDDSINRQNTSMEQRKESLIKQFATLEGTVSRLKGLGDQIALSLGAVRR